MVCKVIRLTVFLVESILIYRSLALERATQLLLDIVGGEAGPVIEVVDHGHLPKPPVILLRRTQIPRLLGIELSDSQVVRNFRIFGNES